MEDEKWDCIVSSTALTAGPTLCRDILSRSSHCLLVLKNTVNQFHPQDSAIHVQVSQVNPEMWPVGSSTQMASSRSCSYSYSPYVSRNPRSCSWKASWYYSMEALSMSQSRAVYVFFYIRECQKLSNACALWNASVLLSLERQLHHC